MAQFRIEDTIDLSRMRRERVEKVRDRMKRDGIGALLCFHPDNIQYLTDVSGGMVRSLPTALNVLFPRTGDPLFFEWGNRYWRIRDELAPWLKGKVYHGWRLGQYLGAGIYPQEFIDDLKKRLGEHDVLNEPLGIDIPIVTLGLPEIFKKAGIKPVDGGGILLDVRKIKTVDEIECQRIASSICDQLFSAIQEAIRPGIRESELQAIGAEAALRMGCDTPPELVLCSGENTSPNMGGFSNRPVKWGDLIFIDPALVEWRGYHVCYYRTFVCGKATVKQKDLYRKNLDLLRKAMAKVKAGATTADICKQWPGHEYWGLKSWFEGPEIAVGHGIGLGIQEGPIITPLFSLEHPVPLEENMVIALETWLSSGDHPKQAVRVEETVVVKKDGYELLTSWPIEEVTEAWR